MNDASKKAFSSYWVEYMLQNKSASINVTDVFNSWQASRKQTLRDVLEMLPEKDIVPDEESHIPELSDGPNAWNECIDEIRALIEKKLESV